MKNFKLINTIRILFLTVNYLTNIFLPFMARINFIFNYVTLTHMFTCAVDCLLLPCVPHGRTWSRASFLVMIDTLRFIR